MFSTKKLCIVFLVQPEASIRTFMEKVLHEHGALVFSASTAGGALQFLQGYKDDIHLVIIDHYLPDASGLELAQSIARQLPGTRIVLTTTTPADESLDEWHGRILRKPLKAAALRAQVERALKAAPCETLPPKARASEAGL